MVFDTTLKFSIPEEFSSQLNFVNTNLNPHHGKTDGEIIQSLQEFVPVTSEKNIWAFWDKGIDMLPRWCQRNVCDWVRICGGGDKPWTVRVLDAIPDSPNYALKYVPAEMLPQSFVVGEMTGPYVGPHSADFLRGALLYRHGGSFSDVGNILFRHLDRVGWEELEDPASPYQISVPLMYGQVIANGFIMARKEDPFIKRWHELFIHLWRGRKSYEGILQDPLLKFATEIDFTDSRAANYHWSFKIEPLVVLEYVSQVVSWLRLTMLEDAGDGFSATEYWQHKVFTFDALQEDWGIEATIGFNGEDAYKTLSTRLDIDPHSPEYKKANDVVWRLLTKSTMQKITHGKGLTHDKHLGVLWDENEGKDNEPGTFAELLRYGATHFVQTRPNIVQVEAKKPSVTMKKGVFEP